ncbi:hypothetical protein EVAR_88861_1 [Eumeta japonica]|uniref:Uncharacterized protein n=1 Tax=Eumeta variegata TaxID=151549 RepID=A0A4C1Y475_EUMVA|nr:hypothetical protein EVAR_88861_1 [Eumeta japonica]
MIQIAHLNLSRYMIFGRIALKGKVVILELKCEDFFFLRSVRVTAHTQSIMIHLHNVPNAQDIKLKTKFLSHTAPQMNMLLHSDWQFNTSMHHLRGRGGSNSDVITGPQTARGAPMTSSERGRVVFGLYSVYENEHLLFSI